MEILSSKRYKELVGARKEAESRVLEMMQKVETLEQEVKGYFDTVNQNNEYFKAVYNQYKKIELPPFEVLTRDQIVEIYKQSAPVQGVVNFIADNVGEVFRYLELTKDGDIVEQHQVIDLLRRPNDRFTLRKFGVAWAVNKLLFGDASVYAPQEVGANRGVKEMYVIPGQRMAVKQGKIQPLEGYRILGNEQVDIDADRVFMSFDYNPDDDSFYGTSKIVAAASYLSVMEKGMRRQDTALKNGGVSNIITPAADKLGVMPSASDEVEETFNNKENVGKTLALRVPIDVHSLGNTPVDLNILASHKEAVTALCFVYKLPVDLYYGQAKYENAKEAKKQIYEQMAIPMANEFGEDLLHFLELDGDGYELKVNTDLIDVLKDDAGDVLDNLGKMHATLNEMREAYGYEPRPEPWADLPIMPMGIQFGNESVYDIDELEDAPDDKQKEEEE